MKKKASRTWTEGRFSKKNGGCGKEIGAGGKKRKILLQKACNAPMRGDESVMDHETWGENRYRPDLASG